MEKIIKLKKIFKSFNWRDTKIYQPPHQYIVRDGNNKDNFDFVVEFIKENGVEMKFFKKVYKYIFIDNYKAWFIEDVLNREYFYHFGEHLIFDCYFCDPKKLDNKENIKNFLSESVSILGMKKLGDIVVYKAEPKIKDSGGYSGFAVIEESHISTHTFTKRLFNTIDFYSCKEALIYKNVLIDLIKNFFKPKKIEFNYLIRGKSYPEKDLI